MAGELADCTLGDSWLPRHIQSWEGTNIIISRNLIIDDALKDLAKTWKIVLEASNETEFVTAQEGCYRQRREGLNARLSILETQKKRYPKKRFMNIEADNPNRKKFLLREHLRNQSFLIWRQYFVKEKNYKKTMRKFSNLMLKYDLLTRGLLRTFLSRTKQNLISCKKYFLNYF